MNTFNKPPQNILESKEEIFEGYEVALLDPRPNADNSKIFEGKKVYGIEVTIPALAEQCIGNLDPQHSGGDHTRAAIEDAVSCELPPKDAVLATVRPDLDSFGSMALLNMRQNNDILDEDILSKVKKIAEADTFAKGTWPGERELPTIENPWPESKGELSPLSAMVMDFKMQAKERVARLQKWFEKNEIPKDYEEKLETERQDLIKAIENGDIKVNVRDGVALVESTHRSGMDTGYRKAPIVIALNPKFQMQGGEPHIKYTVAQYQNGFVDLKSALSEIQALEVGWGGSPTIIGSPQGVSSKLSMEQVFEIIDKYKIYN